MIHGAMLPRKVSTKKVSSCVVGVKCSRIERLNWNPSPAEGEQGVFLRKAQGVGALLDLVWLSRGRLKRRRFSL
jgi:hypothetical protein